jgi:NADPH:quinone reductase-like Zn-dependent oxidoreductase
MRAIQAAERGGYEALRLVDIPQPQRQAGHALVRVTSAGVTPLDHTVLAGLHPRAEKSPLVPGNEGAGVVMEDPSGRFSAGERVLFFAGPGGVTQDGTFAEITSVPSGNLAALPSEILDEIAAGLPVAYLSAFLALRQAGFREGQSVLAPGVGGSVGNATLKVARALGASQLVSTAGSAAKESAAAADSGLRHVDIVNLERESLADGLARLAPGGVDVVIDALGGPLTGQAVGGLARGGRSVVMGYRAMATPSASLPPVTGRFVYRPTTDLDGPEPRPGWDVVWLTPTDPRLGGRGLVASVIDSWYPAHFMRAVREHLRTGLLLEQPGPTVLVAASLSFTAADAAYERAHHVLLANQLTSTTGGHSFERIEVWSDGGALLATAELVRKHPSVGHSPDPSEEQNREH